MKTRISIITPALVHLLGLALISSISYHVAAADATITDSKGTRTPVTGIRTHLHDSNKGFTYYIGSATETDTEWNSIFLFVDTNRYRVEIPLDIIKTITADRTDPQAKTKTPMRSLQWTVVLSDDTTLIGRPVAFQDFKAKADLGDFSIPHASVAQMVFASPKTTYHATPHGDRAVTFYPTDAEKRILTGAAFIFDDRNQNGCFLRWTYKNNIQFVTEGGATYDITWDKIREIDFRALPAGPTNAVVHFSNRVVRLTSPSGTEYRGSVKDALGVEALSHIGSFDLPVVVPFTSTSGRLTGSSGKLGSEG